MKWLIAGACLGVGIYVVIRKISFGKPDLTVLDRLRGLIYDGAHEYEA